MKYTRTNNSETKVSLLVNLDAADLLKIKSTTVRRLSKTLKVTGFRPGKIPAAVAEKNLDPNFLQSEVAQDAVNKFLFDVIEIEKLRPLDQPSVELSKYVPNDSLELKAEVEILPNVELGDYKNLKVKKQVAAIKDSDITEVIERLRQGMAEKNDVQRPAQEGDEVFIDFVGTKDGEAVAGASGKDYPLTLGSSSFIPGFEEGLVGKKTGDKFDLPLTFPKDYHHKPLAGSEVIFAVTVNRIKEIKKPELTDDFAVKCGPFKTVAELKADVQRELADQKEREATEKLKDELLEKLVAGSKIPVPELLITDQLAGLERDFVQNLMYRGLTLEQYLEDEKLEKAAWQDKELRPKAIKRVEVGLVLAELSKVEAVKATTAELEARLAEFLQQYGSDPEMRKQIDTPEARRDIANRLITEKTVDLLVSLNSK